MSSTTYLGQDQTPRSNVDVKVKFQDHVLHVVHLGHFIHVSQVGHLHIIAHAQCYCFISILYNSGLMQQERRKEKVINYCVFFKLYQTGLHAAPYSVPTLLVVRLSTTNIHVMKRQFLSSGKRSSHYVIAQCYNLYFYRENFAIYPTYLNI